MSDEQTPVISPLPGDEDTADLEEVSPELAVDAFGLTDTGRVRPTNEDQFLVATLVKALHIQQTSLPSPKALRSSDRSHLFVVADGMGGEAAGEKASALALDSVEHYVLDALKWFATCRGRDEDKVLSDFRKALAVAHDRVRAEAAQEPQWRGMGTTLTLAYSLNEELYVAHVGDSRCYLFRHNALHRLTQDHTLVEEMVRRGTLTPDEAPKHKWRHMITSTVGGNSPDVRIDVHRLHLQADDAVLLCSDGLTEMLSGEEIAALMAAEATAEAGCRRLVAAANEKGGKDNITVIIARYSLAKIELAAA